MDLPKEYLNNMQKILQDDYPKYIDAMKNKPISAMRINTTKANADIAKYFDVTKKVFWAKNGYQIKSSKIGKHPYHIAGLVYVQEPSSMLAVASSGLEKETNKDDLCVLDLCVAPGGKTGQIAEILDGKGVLVSNEIERKRATVLLGNVERLGYKNVIITNASPQKLSQDLTEMFDYVFVDAPCSGEGMFRKNPETVLEWNKNLPEFNSQRQKQILSEANKMLKPGGKLVYSTCTFSPKEDEEIALWACQGLGYELQNLPKEVLENTTFLTNKKCRRFYPHIADGEGQFVCVLKKPCQKTEHYANKNSKKPKEESQKVINEYLKNTFELNFAPIYTKIGENWCLINEKLQKVMNLLKNTPIINAGVTVGSVQKDRIIPHNNMFMAYGNDAKNKLNLELDSKELKKFLHGEELENKSNFSGYVCIMSDGHSVGFAKASGTVLKNMFPKGLRI